MRVGHKSSSIYSIGLSKVLRLYYFVKGTFIGSPCVVSAAAADNR